MQLLLRAPSSVGRRSPMRVDEGRNRSSLLAIEKERKACTVLGRGEKSLFSGHPGSESVSYD